MITTSSVILAPQSGLAGIDFLWIPTELARNPDLDWTVKILIALAGTTAHKTTGYKGLLASDQELANFLQLSSPRQVQKVIQRGISSSLLARDQQFKQRLLTSQTQDRHTTGIKIFRDLIEHSEMPWPQKALYSLIASMAKGQQKRCFPSNRWVGNALGLSPIYVRKLITQLVKQGYLAPTYGKRSRDLKVTGNLSSQVKPSQMMALNGPPDGPRISPLPPFNGPVVSPIRIEDIKESKDIFPAAPENLLFEGKELQAGKEFLATTTSSNQVDNTLSIQSSEIQNAVSQTNSTTNAITLIDAPRWNPLTDFEWQYKQLLTVIKGCYSAMQQAQAISRSIPLMIDDAILQDFCLNQFKGQLIAFDPTHQRLSFTQAVGDFQWTLFRSWFGMRHVGQQTPKKYDVWLITKNTNDLAKFIQRYPKIHQQLRKQTEFDSAIETITQPVRDQVFFNWLRHNWSKRWNPIGNVLFAEIPANILDPDEFDKVQLEFDCSRKYAITQYRANKQKPIPELLHDGATQCSPLWSIAFAWLMLHRIGLKEDAKQYEAEVIEGFKCRPEVLQLYRERAPAVMQRIKSDSVCLVSDQQS